MGQWPANWPPCSFRHTDYPHQPPAAALVYTYIAACVAYAAVGGTRGLKRIAGTLKWVVTSVLTVVLLVFVGYLTVSGVIAGSTDAVTVKAAKFTMSSLVPVVGGILSDAAETVLAGAGILKNAVGVFGMLAVLCMCVAPLPPARYPLPDI